MIPDHLNENITVPRPPLGCKPIWMLNEERMHELIGALYRRAEWCSGEGRRDPCYFKPDLALVLEWADELAHLARMNFERIVKNDSNV